MKKLVHAMSNANVWGGGVKAYGKRNARRASRRQAKNNVRKAHQIYNLNEK